MREKARARTRILAALLGGVLGGAIPVLLLLYPWSAPGGRMLDFLRVALALLALAAGCAGYWLLRSPASPCRGERRLEYYVAGVMVLALVVTLVGFGAISRLSSLAPRPVEVPALARVKLPPPQPPSTSSSGVREPGAPPPTGSSELQNPVPPPEAMAVKATEPPAGEALVKKHCLGCHTYQGEGFGPPGDLEKAAEKYTMSFFIQLLRDPVNVGKKFMPKLELQDSEILAIAEFLAGRGGPRGQEQPWYLRETENLAWEDLVEAGRKAWQRFNCGSCHKNEDLAVEADGKKQDVGGEMGPDLSHIGAQRSREELYSFFQDYFTRPGTMMPFLPLSRDDIEALSAYLSSLK